MPTEPTTQDITEEIRGLFDTQIGHIADKSARWLFRHKENVQGDIRILAEELEEHLDFQRLTAPEQKFCGRYAARLTVRYGVQCAVS